MRLTINPFKMSLPVQVLLIVLGVALFGHYIPLQYKEFFYAISLTLREILQFILPVIIFSYLSSCILSLGKNGGVIAFIVILLVSIIFSNFIAVIFSYFGSILGSGLFQSMGDSSTSTSNTVLDTMWAFNLPKLKSEYVPFVLLSGIASGVFFSFVPVKSFETLTNTMKNFCNFFLIKIFTPIVPLFVLGFMISLEHEGLLKTVITYYAPLYFYVSAFCVAYICLLFFIFSGFNIKKAAFQVRNCFATAVTGFSTMSSAISMPFAIRAAEANTNNPNLARTIIPASINPHMIGNCVITPILAIAILSSNNIEFPTFTLFISFAFMFAITQLAGAAVPNGAIYIMLPLLQTYLGFNESMTSLIVTLYVLFDAPITAGNIVGNVALTSGLNKLLTKLGIVPPVDDTPIAEEEIA